MSEPGQVRAGRAEVLLTWLIVAVTAVVLPALVVGILILAGAIAAGGDLDHLILRPLPLPADALLVLVYGLIPALSLAAVALGLAGKPGPAALPRLTVFLRRKIWR